VENSLCGELALWRTRSVENSLVENSLVENSLVENSLVENSLRRTR
jgi:hypothetical protein